MSTPTTATATLAHSHYNPHHYPYSHHHQPYSQANSASYRSTNPILPAATRLPFPPSLSSHPASNGISLVASSKDLELAPLAIRADTNYTTSASSSTPTMAAAVAHSRALPEPQQTRKRRRSRGPDWEDFYKNGLPKEVIVIDDTPEPQTPASVAISSSTQLTNGHANGSVNGASNDLNRHVAKKRRRNDETAQYDPVYHNNFVGSHTTTPRRIASPSKSTVSSDRTNSAIHTTAATSLGSLSSSNGQYDYDAQPGQKRKRTRQQIAIEARRRETGALTDTYTSYRPPPYPPKKAGDVHVKVIADVCILSPVSFRSRALTTGIRSTHTTRTFVLTTTMATTLLCLIMTLPTDVSATVVASRGCSSENLAQTDRY